jgi:FlaA1/EpsC-like NDP-sugar epimerase
MKRFFMTIPEAVHLVLQAGAMGTGGELFVLKMGEPLRIVELAEDLIRLSGPQAREVSIVYTGLRPGEKLEEALWEETATVHETEHPDVLRVTEDSPLTEPQCSALLAAFEAAAVHVDRATLDALLSEFIPTFDRPAPGRPVSIL